MPEHQQIQQSKKTNTIFQKQPTPISQTPISNPYTIIQRARINPKSLTHADIMQLQRTIGNRAVGSLLSSIGSFSTAQQETVQRQEISEKEEACPSCMQRQEIPEEEEPLQGKFASTDSSVQRQEIPEEEEPIQGRFETIQRQEIPEEEKPLQGKMIETIQCQEIPEEEKPLQGKFENKPEIACPSCFTTPIVQRQEIPEEEEPLQTKRENNTGMPDNLKAGVENLSGIDMSDVRVHYNSSKPADVGALAYTQGTNIHVAPGQERHLSHEAWHVVQQSQGRVKPTMQAKGVAINDDVSLEHEADVMGEKSLQMRQVAQQLQSRHLFDMPVQRKAGLEEKQLQTMTAKSATLQRQSMDEKEIEKLGGAVVQAKLRNPSHENIVIQRAYTARRPLRGWIQAPFCDLREEAKVHNKGLFHAHIFFEDGENPHDIGFHDDNPKLFQDTPNMIGKYIKIITNLDDENMRLAVEEVGDPGEYHLFGNNCQAYVEKVLTAYRKLTRNYGHGD